VVLAVVEVVLLAVVEVVLLAVVEVVLVAVVKQRIAGPPWHIYSAVPSRATKLVLSPHNYEPP